MTELTPERIRDALEVVTELGLRGAGDWVLESLGTCAARLEREQVAEAQRERRISELTDELIAIACPSPFPSVATMRMMERVARALVDS